MSKQDYYETYEPAPAGLDLLHAPPDVLDFHGIPPKPDAMAEPLLFDFWKKLVAPPFLAERPTFSCIVSKSLTELHTFARESTPETRLPLSSGGAVQSSLNWSGAVVSPPWPKRIVVAVGGWKAPNVRPASAPALFTTSDDPRSLAWVGIDGHNAMLPKISLPQIGTAHWVGAPHFAWWDWWSHEPKCGIKKSKCGIKKINDFQVEPGNEILAGLSVLASDDVLFFIKNQSTGAFRSFLARRQPLGVIEPLGSSVEWVMERPTDPANGQLYPLPAYDPVDFKYCLALAADRPNAPARTMTLAQNGLMVRMRECFADPFRTVYVSRAERRHDPDGSIGVTCTFREPV